LILKYYHDNISLSTERIPFWICIWYAIFKNKGACYDTISQGHPYLSGVINYDPDIASYRFIKTCAGGGSGKKLH
jgi:hypothetical protein